MFSRPCLQTLGTSSFPRHAISDKCLTSYRVGAVLYTSYLSILGTLYHPSSQSVKRIYPPPPVYYTALSGFSAGVVQYVFEALVLCLQLRLESCDPSCHCLFLRHISRLEKTQPRSMLAAPLDALSVRFRTSEVLSGKYSTMWQYGRRKLREIGPRGIFAGWGYH